MTKARDLANIISGGFTADDIPNIDTAKITSGTFVDARLPATALNSNVDLTTLSASNLTSGTVATARLGSGTASSSTFLRGDGSFATPVGGANTPAFIATLSGNQTLGDGTNTKIALNTASIDTNSAFDTTNNKFVVPSNQDGKYYFYAQLISDSGDVEYLETTIAKNGSEVNYIISNPDSSHATLQTNIATILDLSATDYVELFCTSNQSSGNATIVHGVRGKSTYLLGYKLIT